MSKVAVFSAGSWGTAFSIVLADAGNDVTIWARREEVADAINKKRENTDYLPGIELPPRGRRDATTPQRRWPAPTSSCWPCRRRRCARTSPSGRRTSSRRRRARVADEGRRARHPQADERGDRGGHRRRPRADRRGQRAQPGQGDRPPRAGRLGGRLRRRGRSPSGSRTACHSPAFRPYTSTDVLGCELGGAYKNVVGLAVGMAVGLGFGDNTTASVITRGLAETARLAMALGANPLTLMGLAGPRRPGRHLLLAAVAQPHLRREPRPGHDHRGDLRLHPPGRRGRQVLLLAAGAGPAHRHRRPDRRSTSTPSSPAG